MNNVPSELLDPRNTWGSKKEWEAKAIQLAQLFKNNFEKFCDSDEGIRLLNSGPQI
jgi:phosphoenolpyruvate carboxykinase (ATP)